MKWLRLVGVLLFIALAGILLVACEPETPEKEFKVAIVLDTVMADQGMGSSHIKAAEYIREQFDDVEVTLMELVEEGSHAESVFSELGEKGYDAVFAATGAYYDSITRVAPQYPDTKYEFYYWPPFETIDNLRVHGHNGYEAEYLAGMVAGKMTESNVIGYIASFPWSYLFVHVNAFALGVQSVNPEAVVNVVWTNSWHDPATEKEAALSLIDIGADVIKQICNSAAAQVEAQKHGIYSMAMYIDNSEFAPEAHLVSPIHNWGIYYAKVINEIKQGKWNNKHYEDGLDTGVIALSDFNEVVPEEVREMVEAKKQEIISGDFFIYEGPIKSQDGVVQIAAGERPASEDLYLMTWLVEGIVGTTE